MNKKLISSLLTVAMAINIFAIMPLNVFAIGSESKVYEKDGYTVTYRIGSEWDNNRSVEVTIENTGDEAILNWALKYDTGGEVYNLWNSKIYDSTEDYTIIKNNGYNYEIEPGRSANYGYIVTGAETLIPENIELCCRRIDVKSGYDVDFNVTSDWYTGFQAEIAITNTSAEPIEAWTLDFNSNFDINNIWNAKLLSSEEQSYVTANQLWTTPINPGASASFGFTADKSATENAWAENFTLTAVVVGESSLEKESEIDYELDTDSDGLPDYYEEIIGSDPKTEHSDDDQLPDGYEALYLGTDPSKSDSDDNGISDADEDFDTDGLTNLEEYNLGTDPFLEDSDYDTLSDKDEVNIYGTNPTKGDTDDDLVPDGDEVKLGLDPNSGSTNGTPDSERTFPQVVTAESEVLAAVNDDEETPFDVSLEITAAGVAESNVYARESGYSNAIENPSIIGIAPEFVYTDGLAVEEVTVKFELDDSIVDNTLGTYVSDSTEFEGIKRLNVFMFFEDINMLLPVETFHDEATNTVYTTTDRMGTYCLVDMELFFDNLDISPSDDEIEEDYDIETQEFLDEPVFSSYNISELKINTGYTEYKDNFDVVFIIDRVNYDDETIAQCCDKILNTATAIWNTSPNVSCTVYTINGDAITHFEKYGNLKSRDDLNAVLEGITQNEAMYGLSQTYISKAVDNIISTYDASGTKKIYVFAFFDSNNNLCQFKHDSKAELYGVKYGGKSINISVTSEFSDELKNIDSYIDMPYTVAMYKMTNGIYIDNGENFVDDALNHIYGKTPETVYTYDAIIATGYQKVVLDKPLSQQDMANAEKILDDPSYQFSTAELVDCADTDGDGLWDFEEVMYYAETGEQLITIENGQTKLPPMTTILKIFDDFERYSYVESGLEQTRKKYGDYWALFISNPVLPIYSDPTHKDGDRDEISDELDGEALLSNKHYGIFVNYINEQKIEFDDVISDGKVSICTIPITELGFEIGFESFVCYDEYGDYYETDIFNKDKIIDGYFDNWYLIAKNNNEMISYGVAYTENCQEFVDKYSDPFKVFSKAIDSYIMSIETVYNGYIEDGIWKASWDNFTGRVSAYAESAVKDIGTLADVINVIRQRFSPKPSSSLYFSPSIENDFSNQSYEAKWTYAYQKFEEKHLNSDSDTFMASKTIGYTEQMMYDVGIMFVGGFVGTGGEILVYSSVAAAPKTLGTSLVIVIPAEAVAVVGAGVTATGTILLASDTNGYNQASQAMRDAEMLQPTDRISNTKWKHIKNTHVVSSIKKQIQSGNLSKEQIVGKLEKSFFNPDWTDDEIYETINQAYLAAKQNGNPYGDFEFKYIYKGDTITLEFDKDGFKTAYGDYRYTYEEFMKLIGEE